MGKFWIWGALGSACVVAIAALALLLLGPDRDERGLEVRGETGAFAYPRPSVAASMDTETASLDLGRAVVVGAVGVPVQAACQRCHGMDGVGDGAGAFPRLSGLSEWYLYKQMRDYAAGARPNAVMTPIAQALTDAQMQASARWYAAQEGDAPRAAEVAPLTLQQGGVIAAVGIPERGVAACTACHGPGGWGGPAVPAIAGQYAPYAMLQLRLYAENVRRNDPGGVMRQVADGLTPEEMRAVSLYYAAIPRPERDVASR